MGNNEAEKARTRNDGEPASPLRDSCVVFRAYTLCSKRLTGKLLLTYFPVLLNSYKLYRGPLLCAICVVLSVSYSDTTSTYCSSF